MTVWITEFGDMGTMPRSSDTDVLNNPYPQAPAADANMTVQATLDPATAKLSAAFAATTTLIMVYSDGSAKIHIKQQATTADAATTDMPWPDGVPCWLGVQPGEKISVIVGT